MSNPDYFIPGSYSHSFNVEIAKKISVSAAIVYNHIVYWLKINKSKKTNFIDGKTWMYETVAEISDFFGYLTERQVEHSIKQLVDAQLIFKGNYNDNKFDRTAWYSLPDESILDYSKKVFEGTPNVKCKVRSNVNGSYAKSEMEPTPKRDCIIQEEQQEEYHKEQQQQSVDVVVSDKKRKADSEKTKDDVYHFSLTSRKDWIPDEIEYAWQVYQDSEAIVSNVFAYVEGIIQNFRTLNQSRKSKQKKQKEKPCLNNSVANSNQELKDIKSRRSDPGISEQTLDSLLGPNRIRQKY